MAKAHAAAISNRPSRPSAQREFPHKNKNRGVQVVKLHVPFLFSLRRLWYQTQPVPRRKLQSKPCCRFP